MDLAMIEAVSFVFPWIIHRKAKHSHWFKDHWNGRSKGLNKDFPFESLYTAAWIGSYGESSGNLSMSYGGESAASSVGGMHIGSISGGDLTLGLGSSCIYLSSIIIS